MSTSTPKRSSRSPRRTSAEKAIMLSSKVKSIRGIVSEDWKPSLGLNSSNSSLDDHNKLVSSSSENETKDSKERRNRSRRGSPNSVIQRPASDDEEEQEEEMELISCPACASMKLPKGANFCSNCGHCLHDSFCSDDGDSQSGGRSVGSSGSRSSKSSKRRRPARKPKRSVTIDEEEAQDIMNPKSSGRSRSGSRTSRRKSSREDGAEPTVLARSGSGGSIGGMEKVAAARAKGRNSTKLRRSTTVCTMDSTSVASEDSIDQIAVKTQRKTFRRSSSFASMNSKVGFEDQLADIRKQLSQRQLSQKSLLASSAHGPPTKGGKGDRTALANAIRSQSCRELNTKNGSEHDAVMRHVAKHVNQKTKRLSAINWRGAAKQAAQASKIPPSASQPAAGTILKLHNSSSGSISSISYSTGLTSKDETTVSSMGSADVPGAALPPTLSRWESGLTMNSGHGTKEAADSIPNRPEQDLSSVCSSSVSGSGNSGGVPRVAATARLMSSSGLEEEEEPETPRSSSGRNKMYPDLLFPATPCGSTRSGVSALTTPTCFKTSIVTPGSVTDTPNSIQLSAIGQQRARVPSVGYEFSATNSTNHVSDLSCSSSFLMSSSSSFLYTGSTQHSSQSRLAKFLSTPTIEEEASSSNTNRKGDCTPRMVRRHSFDSVSACSAFEPSNNTDDAQPMPPQRRVSLMPTTA